MSDADLIVCAYKAAVESFTNLEASFHDTAPPDVNTSIKELTSCSSIIKYVYNLETTDVFETALFQIHCELDELVQKLESVRGVRKPAPEQKQAVAVPSDTLTAIKTVPSVSGFRDLAGLHDVKKVLKAMVTIRKYQPQLCEGLANVNSILLFGPPGTGKTKLAHALAAEEKCAFYCLSASDVLSKFLGETERLIKNVFQTLKSSHDFSILFIDEIDGLCRNRQDDESDHVRRIKTELMIQFSSIENCSNVLIMCATNCPWDLDPSFMRRFQKTFYFPLPTPSERVETLRLLTESTPLEPPFHQTLLKQTEGFSNSDLANVVRAALGKPLTELIDTKWWKLCEDGFYEPSTDADFTRTCFCELSQLPRNRARARKVEWSDLHCAAGEMIRTVKEAHVRRFEDFVRDRV